MTPPRRPSLQTLVMIATLLAMVGWQGIATAAAEPLLKYQARITDPDTGEPLNGSVRANFAIYDAAEGGTPLWSEQLQIEATDGLASAILGQTAPLPIDEFAFAPLWLGVRIGSDEEATPRERLLAAPYASRSDVAVNAFLFNGLPANAFALSGHSHAGQYLPVTGPATLTATGDQQPALSIQQSGAAPALQTAGYIRADSLRYNSPRVQRLAIPGDVFLPRGNTVGHTGSGGVHVSGGSGTSLRAPVHLPEGAVITGMTAYFVDNSPPADLTVSLLRYFFAVGTSSSLASVSSTGSSAQVRSQTTTLASQPIEHATSALVIAAGAPDWGTHGSAITLQAVVITYQLSEAP